jgi:hypothetical protein
VRSNRDASWLLRAGDRQAPSSIQVATGTLFDTPSVRCAHDPNLPSPRSGGGFLCALRCAAGGVISALMSESQVDYAARAKSAGEAAANEPLANVRQKHMEDAGTWHGLAKLAGKLELARGSEHPSDG